MAAIALRGDFDGAGLRACAKQCKDGPQTRRLLALAAIYEGASRSDVKQRPKLTSKVSVRSRPF